MVDQSEFAWRILTRSFLPSNSARALIAYSPMLHARLFKEKQVFRDQHFQPARSGLATTATNKPDIPDIYLDGNPSVDRPLFVQFCANSPDDLLEAARYVAPFCDAIDLNLGCPQGIARKGFYGAFLQEHWDLVYRLINTLHTSLDIPVTAKMRILETKEKTLEYAKMILSAGASIITVHGRQRDQKGHKTGVADWSVIRFLREQLPLDTVIFANGNILQHHDISHCLEKTGADAVMSAEGNLYDPTIFSQPPDPDLQNREYWRGRDGKGGYRMDAVFRRYMDIIYRYVLETSPPHRAPLFLYPDPSDSAEPSPSSKDHLPPTDEAPASKKQKPDAKSTSKSQTKTKPPRTTSPSLLAMQAHLFHLLRPLVSTHTHIRDALARCRAGDMPAFEHVLQLTETATREGLQDYAFDPSKYEYGAKDDGTQEIDTENSAAAIRRCRRPWWVCQPYVRPLPKEALERGSLRLSKREKRRIEEEEKKKQGAIMRDQKGTSERERLDIGDGVPATETAEEAMVCG
ncbi:MAG: hypothetical protein Q9190_000854 [Brigantiaea leucoxantha]